MKQIVILGSTGSIGRQALEIVARQPADFSVVGLACGNDIETLAAQINRFKPKMVSCGTPELAATLKARIGNAHCDIWHGVDGAVTLARLNGADLVVSAMVGAAGLVPTMAAIHAGKTVALANKETLVAGGEIVMTAAARSGSQILPIDSEHSAIFQCLAGHRRADVKKIILTASGGPFLHTDYETLRHVTPEAALKHPNWSMGSKITIDSATMMNKGLELIEARWLFDLPPAQIEIIIHPQSIIHSMVEYIDGSIMAELSHPDMRAPIAYALSYPDRLPTFIKPMNWSEVGTLTFLKAEGPKYRSLQLARAAAEAGRSLPATLNAANEIAVEAFLAGRIPFLRIPELVATCLDQHRDHPLSTVDDVIACDREARALARRLL